jgi:zinc transport system permease protein
MFSILSYDFFQNALIAWIIISLITWMLWTLVVLRREPNVTHAIANILFLWIVISFFFSGDYYVYAFIFAILGAIILSILDRFSNTWPESSKEIISQIWLAWAIFWIWLLWNVQIDIYSFLFWNILFVNQIDILLLGWLLVIWFILFVYFWKKLVRISLSPEITKSQWISVWLYQFWYMLYLAIFIAITLKIFWVLLLWAFLVLPGNIGRVISKSLKWVFLIAISCSLLSVILWLFLSYYFDTSAWASIVLLLWVMFFMSIGIVKKR